MNPSRKFYYLFFHILKQRAGGFKHKDLVKDYTSEAWKITQQYAYNHFVAGFVVGVIIGALILYAIISF
jgi:F0F1-type ATP synthase assembly protein I